MDATDPKELHPQTLLALKLIQQPFSKPPTADKLFDFDSLIQTRDTVQHHLQFSHLLLVIQSKQGGGKRSFAMSLMGSEHPYLVFFQATATVESTLDELLALAAENTNTDSIHGLEQLMAEIMQRGQQPVLLINEAHCLSRDVLKELIQYSQSIKDASQQASVKLLLLGEHGIENKLEQNDILNHNQYYIIELPQLNVSNTRAFLMHRLTAAGFRDDNPFRDKDITQIFTSAAGNPGDTLEHAAAILNRRKDLLDTLIRPTQKPKWMLIAVGAAIIVAALLFNFLLTSDDEDIAEPVPLPQPQPQQPIQAIDLLKPLETTEPAAIDETEPVEIEAPQVAEAQPSEVEPEPRIEIPEPISETQQPVKETPTVETKIEKPVAEVTQKTVTSTITPPSPAEMTPEPAKKAIPTRSTESIKPLVKPIPKAPPLTSKSPGPSVDPVNTAFIEAGLHDESWLLAQHDNQWSLQLLGGHQPETLLKFIHQHQIHSNVAYFRTQLSGKDWYVVLYGLYPSKDLAKAAIATLPAGLRSNNPWARDLKSVQQLIRAHR